jgi:hypothetical protein
MGILSCHGLYRKKYSCDKWVIPAHLEQVDLELGVHEETTCSLLYSQEACAGVASIMETKHLHQWRQSICINHLSFHQHFSIHHEEIPVLVVLMTVGNNNPSGMDQ